ncbi:zinc-binding alcohol dehydrogenase family protein [Paenibacillus sp. 1P07SE]|uniref:zinc-binding alcohol dehydrogenase family protein n=1 Tax=Paenibacillus sp. 1P07SE TaxID=3132209 RepID=UPI0039A4B74C
MRQIVCEAPDKLVLTEGVIPPCGEGEARVRIRRVGICGTDLHAYKGNQPFFSYPRILGHELSGEIEQLGSDVQGLAVGDRVSVVPYLACGSCIACRKGKSNCCVSMQVLGVHLDGGLRESIVVPASQLLPASDLTWDQAAMLEPLGIGAHAVRRSGLEAGDTALVIGAGPIGLGVMAMARERGARVIAMDLQAERLRFCQSWAGVEATVAAGPDAAGELQALTGDAYPDVVFDATGHAGSMNGAFAYTSHGGTLVYVGLVKADISFHDPEFHKRELTLMGSRNATREDFEAVRRVIAKGDIDIERYITHRADFGGMIDVFEDWLLPESGVIKAVVEL